MTAFEDFEGLSLRQISDRRHVHDHADGDQTIVVPARVQSRRCGMFAASSG